MIALVTTVDFSSQCVGSHLSSFNRTAIVTDSNVSSPTTSSTLANGASSSTSSYPEEHPDARHRDSETSVSNNVGEHLLDREEQTQPVSGSTPITASKVRLPEEGSQAPSESDLPKKESPLQHNGEDSNYMTAATTDEVTKASLPEESRSLRKPRYIVGIGASAGGLEALEVFFDNMPAKTGLAFVIVQHLSPDFKSLMEELLARRTEIPVHRVEDNMEVESDAIYLIPPRKEMIVSEGRLLLMDKDPSRIFTLPIDTFFRSLAYDAKERAIAVILSGTGSDGSRAIKAVRDAGGLVVVQSPETAKFDGMPRSALDTGSVDYVLPVGEIPALLLRYAERPSRDYLPNVRTLTPAIDDNRAIFDILRASYGIDFSYYKPNTVGRRIERRLQLCGCADLGEYLALLKQRPDEANSLYKDLLIGVTKFFRDKEAFEVLSKTIVPQILSNLPVGEELRVWASGCATGEEAYSIAIIISENLSTLGRPVDVRIFATDVHKESIDFASAGIYEAESLENVEPERQQRFFNKVGERSQVSQALRKMIVFAPHNLIKDAPFTKLDLISCRNLLIYLQPQAQRKALSLFHFGLRRGGFLFLGPSESTGELEEEFEAIDKQNKFFRKRREVNLLPDITSPLPSSLSGPRPTGNLPYSALSIASTAPMRMLSVYEALVNESLPFSLLISETRKVIHSFGGASQLLQPRDGPVSTDILDLVGPQLRLALSGAIQQVRMSHQPAIYRGIALRYDGEDRFATMSVKPLRSGKLDQSYILLQFELEPIAADSIGESDAIEIRQVSQELLSTLETELRFTRENLQATIEELEASNEELQATNEELVASNEELQSTNEELHSVNEELYTVNAEYQNKIGELTEVTNDLDNILKSSDVGIIFLDRLLRVRKFTPQIANIFKLLPQDIGRPLESFAHTINYPGLLEDVRRVLQSEARIEKEVKDKGGDWFLLRILPYYGTSPRDGALITLVNISHLKNAQEQLLRLSSIVASSGSAIISTDPDGIVTSWNAAATQTFGFSTQEAIGRSIDFLLPENLLERESFSKIDFSQVGRSETVRRTKTGAVLNVEISYAPLSGNLEDRTGAAFIITDITDKRRSHAALQASESRFRHVANSVPALIFMTNPNGQYNYFNEQWLEFSGYMSLDEIAHGWTHLIHPDQVAEFQKASRNSIVHHEPFSCEIRIRHRSGVYRWVLIRAVPRIDDAGNFLGLVASCVDVHDRRCAEEALRNNEEQLATFFESASVGLIWMDSQGEILRSNHVAAENLGYSIEDFKQLSFKALFCKADEAASFFSKVLSGNSIQNLEVSLKDRNGSDKHILIDASSILQNSNLKILRCMLRDITEGKKEFQVAKEGVARRDRFLATLSHELRNPVNALLNAVRLMDSARASEETKDNAFKVVKRQSHHMSILLNDLLDITTVTQGRIRLNKSMLDARSLVSDGVELARPALEGRSQSVRVSLPEDAVTLVGDYSRLVQVLENLLSNASKYSPDGSEITVSMIKSDNDVRIAISDHGRGIPSHMLTRIFDSFVQLDEYTGKPPSGLGLGLTLVKNFVELHGGSIVATSEGLGKGSTFTITLPKAPEAGGKDLPSPEIAPADVSIVLIEDDYDNLNMFRTFLELDGYKVSHASSGEEGIALILQQRPLIAFIDVGLPDLSGHEVARKVRQYLPPEQCRLVALTGYSRPEDKLASKEAGFDEHLVKPFEAIDLERVLSQVRTQASRSHQGSTAVLDL